MTLRIIEGLVDAESFYEVQPDYAENMVTGFARLDGASIGIVANQPLAMAGVLCIDSSLKAARFVRFCDAFNIPLLVLVDVPGFYLEPIRNGEDYQAWGPKLLYALCEATVPKCTVITRKAYGGAYDVMNSKIYEPIII